MPFGSALYALALHVVVDVGCFCCVLLLVDIVLLLMWVVVVVLCC